MCPMELRKDMRTEVDLAASSRPNVWYLAEPLAGTPEACSFPIKLLSDMLEEFAALMGGWIDSFKKPNNGELSYLGRLLVFACRADITVTAMIHRQTDVCTDTSEKEDNPHGDSKPGPKRFIAHRSKLNRTRSAFKTLRSYPLYIRKT
jgi:hypothetical protein